MNSIPNVTSVEPSSPAAPSSQKSGKPYVRERRDLFSEPVIVDADIPSGARESVRRDGSGRYLQYLYPVSGGVINAFLQIPAGKSAEDYRNREIHAKPKIVRQTYDDGESFIFIELVPADAPATHKMCVVDGFPEDVPNLYIFRTPQKPPEERKTGGRVLKGSIIISPL